MQKLLCFTFLLFLNFLVRAQTITPEHIYKGKSITRFQLANGAEKYALTDSANNFKIYNADHTFYRYIPANLPASVSKPFIMQIADKTIVPDSSLEVVIAYYENNVLKGKVIDEAGNAILTVNNGYFYIGSLNNLPDQLVCRDYQNSLTDFYNLPFTTPNLSHRFTSSNNVYRDLVGTKGVKYCNFNSTSGLVEFYNPDYSLWKTVIPNLPTGMKFNSLFATSDNIFNTDTLVEVAYLVSTGTTPTKTWFMITNENGNLILTDSSNYLKGSYSGNPQQPDKLVIVGNNGALTNVYSLPGPNLEYTFQGYAGSSYFKNGGTQFVSVNPLNLSNPVISVYDYSYHFIRNIPISLPVGTTQWYALSVTDTLIDPNSAIEYLIESFAGRIPTYILASEYGTTYLTTTGMPNGTLSFSNYQPLDTKLFKISSVVNANNIEVYKLPLRNTIGVMPAEKHLLDPYIYTFTGGRTIVFCYPENQIVAESLKILDTKGAAIPFTAQKTEKGTEISGPMPGCYFLWYLTGNGQRKAIRFVID